METTNPSGTLGLPSYGNEYENHTAARYRKLLDIMGLQFFHNILPCNRFKEIFWLLHVGVPGNTPRKVDKINIFNYRNLSGSTGHPKTSPYITIVGFCGRFGSIQYMPQKPTKWGITRHSFWQMQLMAIY